MTSGGDGNLIHDLLLHKSKINIYLTDISPTRIKHARSIVKRKSIKYIVDDILNTKLPRNKFDFINSDMVIEHVLDDNLMINNISKLLKPNCNFRISTVFRNKLHFWFHLNKIGFVLDETHVREYEDLFSLKNSFSQNNLIIDSIHLEKVYFNFAGFKLWKLGYYFLIIKGHKKDLK